MIHKVGMAEAKVAGDGDSLRTLGLGSCVGVALFDSVLKLAGLAHIMLPSSGGKTDLPAKYADTGVPHLIALMSARGSRTVNLTAKLAGGAQMFAATMGMDIVRVGPRNVDAVRLALEDARIRVISSDVGGSVGRTVELSSLDGCFFIRTAQFGEKHI